jgi:hypothetical protein
VMRVGAGHGLMRDYDLCILDIDCSSPLFADLILRRGWGYMRGRRTRRPVMARGTQAVLVGILIILMLLTSSDGLAPPRELSTIRVGSTVMASTGATHPAGGGAPNVTWVIDFADYAGRPIEA